MTQFEIISSATTIGFNHKEKIIKFFESIEDYKDMRQEISNAIDHAVGGFLNNAGLLVIGSEDNKIVAALILCKTGMTNFGVQNLIYFLAVDETRNLSEYLTQLLKHTKQNVVGKTALVLPQGSITLKKVQSLLPDQDKNTQILV